LAGRRCRAGCPACVPGRELRHLPRAPSPAAAQFPGKKARTVIGRVATIRGRVAGTRFAATSNGSPTFLNVGVNYPDPRRFTVVIWIEHRSAFGRPDVRYRHKNICVRGRVQSYRGVPEIEARSPSQIRVIRERLDPAR
jgi:hypothetical protein